MPQAALGLGPILGAVKAAVGWAGAHAGALAGVAGAGASIATATRGAPTMPSAPRPVLMPDQAALDLSRRRRLAEEYSRSGRMSTLLGGSSGQRDTLG